MLTHVAAEVLSGDRRPPLGLGGILQRARFVDRDPERRLGPIGRMGTPQEIPEAAVWLYSKAASFATGHALAVDGGLVAQ